MGYHIKTLGLSRKLQQNYNIGTLRNISKINIFVGSNNSGKSRFLRGMLTKHIHFLPPEETVNASEYYTILREFIHEIIDTISKCNIEGIGDLKNNDLMGVLQDELRNNPLIKEREDLFKKAQQLNGEIYDISESSVLHLKSNQHRVNRDDLKPLVYELKEISAAYRKRFSKLTHGTVLSYEEDFKRVYIPTLRGLRGYKDTIINDGININLNNDIYEARTINDYFKDYFKDVKDNQMKESLEIHTGLNLYDEITDMLLGSVQQRHNMVKFQEFLSKSFFDGLQVNLTPDRHSDVIRVRIGAETEKNIYDLGDGIQALIILTFPLFKHLNRNLLLHIEEPELYLHPGMQRKFLEVVLTDKQFEHHQLFITTHSNHFLDMTLDMDRISVYKFNKILGEHSGDPTEEVDANFSIDNVSNEDNSVLQELGVRNSAVLLSNCTIWVEGITDRLYIRRFLKVLQESDDDLKEFKEDIHYSFVEYSGGNITHWSFLDDEDAQVEEGQASMKAERICSNLFLISDKDGDKKRPRQEKLEKVLKERYYCLDCREIENILSAETLKSVIAEYEKSTILEEPLEHLNNSTFTQEDFKNLLLGNFINSLFDKGSRKRIGSYAAKSGTIENKLDFCKRAIKHISTYNDLSDEAQKLSKRLYDFIKTNNQ